MFETIEAENNTYASLVADITHRCNMKCANCYIPNRSFPDMDRDELLGFLARLPRKTFIRLIGAEPTLHPDLKEIISGARKLGHHVSLTTNGLKLSDNAYLDSLWSAGLRMFCLSMNGADEDSVYKILDNGNFAELKINALRNLLRRGALLDVGCIIAKEVNEHSLSRLIDLIVREARAVGRAFNGARIPTIRVKSVGHIGRSMSVERTYSFDELVELVAKTLDLSKSEIMDSPCISGSNLTIGESSPLAKFWKLDSKRRSYFITHKTPAGPIYIRMIDWGEDEFGVPNGGNQNRGRITENWKIAPFFEHLKFNNLGY